MTFVDPAHGLPAALALRLGIIVLTLLLARRHTVARYVAFLGSVLASVLSGLTAAHVLRHLHGGDAVHGAWFVHHASGFAMTYAVDGLSAWFLVVLAVVAAPIALRSASLRRLVRPIGAAALNVWSAVRPARFAVEATRLTVRPARLTRPRPLPRLAAAARPVAAWPLTAGPVTARPRIA